MVVHLDPPQQHPLCCRATLDPKKPPEALGHAVCRAGLSRDKRGYRQASMANTSWAPQDLLIR